MQGQHGVATPRTNLAPCAGPAARHPTAPFPEMIGGSSPGQTPPSPCSSCREKSAGTRLQAGAPLFLTVPLSLGFSLLPCDDLQSLLLVAPGTAPSGALCRRKQSKSPQQAGCPWLRSEPCVLISSLLSSCLEMVSTVPLLFHLSRSGAAGRCSQVINWSGQEKPSCQIQVRNEKIKNLIQQLVSFTNDHEQHEREGAQHRQACNA